MTAWRLIETPPAPGDRNMAIDAMLLESVATSGVCTLRFYEWESPTVSLGYFQNYADRTSHAASAACPLVRRATGGGAIVHDRELTYSVVVPDDDPRAAAPQLLYRLLHDSLIATLGRFGVSATLATARPPVPPATEPFLCFLRRAEGDVLVGQHKVAGSAQRRRRGAVLQHGSVLLETSPAAPELFGIADLGGPKITPSELARAWSTSFADSCGFSWHREPLSGDEIKHAARIAEEVYSGSAWTLRR